MLFASVSRQGAGEMLAAALKFFKKYGIKVTHTAPASQTIFLGFFHDLKGQFCRLPPAKAKKLLALLRNFVYKPKAQYAKEALQEITGLLEHYARVNQLVRKNLTSLTRLVAGLSEKQIIDFRWTGELRPMKGQLLTCLKEVENNENIQYEWFDVRKYKIQRQVWVDASLTEFGIGAVCKDRWSFQLEK